MTFMWPVVFVLGVCAYIGVALGVATAFGDRDQEDIGSLIGIFWPVSVPILGFGWLAYRASKFLLRRYLA